MTVDSRYLPSLGFAPATFQLDSSFLLSRSLWNTWHHTHQTVATVPGGLWKLGNHLRPESKLTQYVKRYRDLNISMVYVHPDDKLSNGWVSKEEVASFSWSDFAKKMVSYLFMILASRLAALKLTFMTNFRMWPLMWQAACFSSKEGPPVSSFSVSCGRSKEIKLHLFSLWHL